MTNNKIVWGIILLVIIVLIVVMYKGSANHISNGTGSSTDNALVVPDGKNIPTGGSATAGGKTGTGTGGTPSAKPIAVATGSAVVLYSVTPAPAKIGLPMTINGKGFNTQPLLASDAANPLWDKNGHLTFTITNSNGMSAVLWHATPDNQGTVVTLKLPAKVCTYAVEGNATCNAYMDIMPGEYKLTASIGFLSLTSNTIVFQVK